MLLIWYAIIACVMLLAWYVRRTIYTTLGANPVDHSVYLQAAELTVDAASSSSTVTPAVLFIILGWGGSTRKQLRRIIEYCRIELCCPVLSYINPMISYALARLDEAAIEELLVQMKHTLESKDIHAPRGFIFIIHSNNGAFIYSALLAKLNDTKSPYAHLKKLLKGVIFDSSPAIQPERDENGLIKKIYRILYNTIGFSFPCVAIILSRPQYIHWFWSPMISIWGLYTVFILYVKSIINGKPMKDTRAILRSGMKTNMPQVPYLFLYSSGDKLLRVSFIHTYIAFLESNLPSADITQVDFITTGHVQHFIKEKEKYATYLKAFIKRVNH